MKGAILLLEDRGEAPYRIDRMLCHMRLSGRLQDIVKDNIAGRDIPLLAGFQIGHDTENLTVPIGLQGTLDTESGMLRFDASATQAL